MKRDLQAFVLSALIGFALIASVNASFATAEQQLLAMQMNKLDDPVEVLFVGDSSLGNSLDAAQASVFSGRRVGNLALTGAFGLPGTQELLGAYLARNGAPQEIWIVQAVDVFRRQTDARTISHAFRPTLVQKSLDLLSFSEASAAVRQQLALRGSSPFQNGYIRQRKALRASDLTPQVAIEPPSEESLAALQNIAALCEKHAVKCTVAIGPHTRHQAADVLRYVRTLAAVLPEPLTLATQTPFLIEDRDLGDSEDHVRPEARTRFSQKWACLFAQGIDCSDDAVE